MDELKAVYTCNNLDCPCHDHPTLVAPQASAPGGMKLTLAYPAKEFAIDPAAPLQGEQESAICEFHNKPKQFCGTCAEELVMPHKLALAEIEKLDGQLVAAERAGIEKGLEMAAQIECSTCRGEDFCSKEIICRPAFEGQPETEWLFWHGSVGTGHQCRASSIRRALASAARKETPHE